MFAKKIILAAAGLAALTATAATAAPFEHRDRDNNREIVRHETIVRQEAVRDFHRPYVARERVFETLRLHRYVGIGEPYFFHGRYVVRSHDRFGHVVLVQLDPWTGAYIGVVRI